MKRVLFILMAAAAISCSKSQPEPVEIVKLGAKPKTVEASECVDTARFEVISDAGYVARIIQGGNWASFLDGSQGLEASGNGTLEVKVNANTGIRRTAKIVLEHANRSDTLRVYQKCLPQYDETVALASTSATIAPEGGSVNIPFTTNVPRSLLTAYAYSDRILELGITNDELSFHVEANRTYNPLNTKVTLSFINGWEQKQSVEVTVFQNFLGMDDPGTDPTAKASFTIGSYNLWAIAARKAEHKAGEASEDRLWGNSQAAVSQCIVDMNLDILGLQEVETEMIGNVTSYLKSSGMGYSSLFFYPDQERPDKQSADGILYKTSRFELVSVQRYWISPTPERQSYGWDEDGYRYRNAFLCHFYDKHLAKNFTVTVIHGPQYAESRSHASDIMISMEKKLNVERYPSFFIGDMNADAADPSDPFTVQMRQYCSDSQDVAKSFAGPKYTFAGPATDAKPFKRLDYIYLHSDSGDAFDVASYHVNDAKYKINGTWYYPSDHLPVYIEVTLK